MKYHTEELNAKESYYILIKICSPGPLLVIYILLLYLDAHEVTKFPL